MTWLTSLPVAVLVISQLVVALLVVTGGRLAVRVLVPAAEREEVHTIAAPLMPGRGPELVVRGRSNYRPPANEAGHMPSWRGSYER